MSIKVMTLVWDGFPASGSDLLAMLALADWCDDRGGSIFPSMRAIGEKIRVSEKQARRIVRSFEQGGYLFVVANAHGGAPGTTKQFCLNVQKLKDLAQQKADTPPTSVTPPMDVTPPTSDPRPLPPVSQTPPTHGSLTTIEPSIEPPLNTVGAKSSVTAQKKHTPEKQKDEFVLPEWINALHWRAWRSHPKLRTASTDQKTIAVEKLSKWRDAGEDYAAALENAAVSGYQGLFLPDSRTVNKRPSATAKASPGKHTGFQNLDYTTGINQDGTFS